MEKINDIVVRERVVSSPLSIVQREDGSESRTVEGYAILFNEESLPLWDDEDGIAVEVISPDAVSKELLDTCDIKMTMFHNREKILARSNKGSGTLSYDVDATGVKFRFDAPQTSLGDEALELVRRGDIAGCSFAFRTRYYDGSCVSHEQSVVDGKVKEVYTVRCILDVCDFTLAADPAYPQTSVSALREKRESEKRALKASAGLAQRSRAEVSSMRAAARWRL